MTQEKPDGPPTIEDAILEAWLAEAQAEPPEPAFWMKLTYHLRHAAELDRQRGTSPTQIPPETVAAQYFLHNLAKLLMEQPFFKRRPDLLAPLHRLSTAVSDLGDGTVSPMFRPVGRGRGHPGKGAQFDLMKGHAARAVTELNMGGMLLDEAAKVVAKALREGGNGRLNAVTPEVVINWREKIMLGRGPGATRAAIFAYKKELPPFMGCTPAERGHNLVETTLRTIGEALL
jgi:hypothetical protein